MKYAIKELGKVSTGNTPSKSEPSFYDSDDIGFVKPDIISEDQITDIVCTNEFISKKARKKARIVPANTVFVTCIGSIGKIGIARNQEYAFNQQINAIEPNEKVLPEYLAFCLLYNKQRLSNISNAPVVPIINKTQFENFEVEISDDIEIQGEQLQTLNRVSVLISAYRQQLAELDTLIKARFVEMFGDGSNFPKRKLSESVEEMFIGPFGSALKNEYFVPQDDGYCMVYEQKHAIRKTMDVETRFISEEKYKELKRFSVFGGDIIVSCRGTIGEIYAVPENAPLGIMHPSIMKIRLKNTVYNKQFFVLQLENYMQKNNDKANGSGVKMAVTATTLGNEMFVVPPLTIQNQFSAFVEQVDKSKAAVQKALDEAQVLFDSLMQKYFG